MNNTYKKNDVIRAEILGYGSVHGYTPPRRTPELRKRWLKTSVDGKEITFYTYLKVNVVEGEKVTLKVTQPHYNNPRVMEIK